MILSEAEISEEIELQKKNFAEMKRLGLIRDFKVDDKINFDDIGKNPYLDIHVQLNIPIKKLFMTEIINEVQASVETVNEVRKAGQASSAEKLSGKVSIKEEEQTKKLIGAGYCNDEEQRMLDLVFGDEI